MSNSNWQIHLRLEFEGCPRTVVSEDASLIGSEDDPQLNVRKVNVSCNGTYSHHFSNLIELQKFSAKLKSLAHSDAVAKEQTKQLMIGEDVKKLFEALFPKNSLALEALSHPMSPHRIVLETDDDKLDEINWEYAYGGVEDDLGQWYLVEKHLFVRQITPKSGNLLDPPSEIGKIHLVMVPSQPIDVSTLKADLQWKRLQEIVNGFQHNILFERAYPPTIRNVQNLLLGNKEAPNKILHFSGHGSVSDAGATLQFEKENGEGEEISPEQLVKYTQGRLFFINVNGCDNAAFGSLEQCNYARNLVAHGVPYALGMRYSIYGDHAHVFAGKFYENVFRGVSVEEALWQTRAELLKDNRSKDSPAFGLAILYTSLNKSVPGFQLEEGYSVIRNRPPKIQIPQVDRARGIFRGRREELFQMGRLLTDENGSCMVTITGSPGQGKTALACEAIEHFGFAFPDGILGVSLRGMPSKQEIIARFISFLEKHHHAKIAVEDPEKMEMELFDLMKNRKIVFVADNIETLIHVRDNELRDNNHTMGKQSVADIFEFFSKFLQEPGRRILATAQQPLDLTGIKEFEIKLGGLNEKEGSELFMDNAIGTTQNEKLDELRFVARKISSMLQGHPLSLKLLASDFKDSRMIDNMDIYLANIEAALGNAEHKDLSADDKNHTLNSCIKYIVDRLPKEMQHFLGYLCFFRGRFEASAIAKIIPQAVDARIHLEGLRDKSLVECETLMHDAIEKHFFYLLPSILFFGTINLQNNLNINDIKDHFGNHYLDIIKQLSCNWKEGGNSSDIFNFITPDIEQAYHFLSRTQQKDYLSCWGSTLNNNGQRQQALEKFEEALSMFREFGDKNGLTTTLTIMGTTYYNIGQPEKALKIYEEALSICNDVGDKAVMATLLNHIGLVYSAVGQPNKALKKYEEALSIYTEIGNKAALAVTFSNIALVYGNTGQPKKALEQLKKAISIDKEIGNSDVLAMSLNDIGLIYGDIGQPHKALEKYEEAILIYREIGDRVGLAKITANIGAVYCKIGKLDKALVKYQEVLPFFDEIGDKSSLAIILNHIGSIYKQMGLHARALEEYSKALYLRTEVGDRAWLAMTLNSIGLIYSDIGQFQPALEKYEEALSIYKEVEDKAGLATTLNSIGALFNGIGQSNQALEMYEEALPIRREVGDKTGLAATLNNIGSVYRNTRQPNKALKKYKEALPIYKEIRDSSGLATTLSNIGTIYSDIGQINKALKIYKEALPIQRDVGDRVGLATTLKNIGSIYGNMGQLDRALHTYREAVSIYEEVGDKAGLATLLNRIGTLYINAGQPDKALEKFEEALLMCKQTEDRAKLIIIMNNIGACYTGIRRPDKALEVFEELVSIHREAEDIAGLVASLNKISAIYSNVGQPYKALEIYNETLLICNRAEDKNGLATTLNNIGLTYSNIGQPNEALEKYKEAIPICREIGDKPGLATLLNNVGTIYNKIGNHKKALENYQEALSIRKDIGDNAGLATTLNGIGTIYNNIGQTKKALEIYEEALPIRREAGDKLGLATTLSNIGTIYCDVGQPNTALEKYKEALSIYRDIKEYTPLVITLNSIGDIYCYIGQSNDALEKYEEAFSIYTDMGEKTGMATTLTSMGSAYSDVGKTRKALEKYEQALLIYKEMGDKVELATLLKNIGSIHIKIGEHNKALEKYEEALSIYREARNKNKEAAALHNIGIIYEKISQPENSLFKYREALSIQNESGDTTGAKKTIQAILNLIKRFPELEESIDGIAHFSQFDTNLEFDIGINPDILPVRCQEQVGNTNQTPLCSESNRLVGGLEQSSVPPESTGQVKNREIIRKIQKCCTVL